MTDDDCDRCPGCGRAAGLTWRECLAWCATMVWCAAFWLGLAVVAAAALTRGVAR